MAVLHTTTGTHVLTVDDPYVIEQVKHRYYFTAELVTAGGTESIRVSVYDAVAHVDLVSPRILSEAAAAAIWQGWYRRCPPRDVAAVLGRQGGQNHRLSDTITHQKEKERGKGSNET